MKTIEHTSSEKQALRRNIDLQVKCCQRFESWADQEGEYCPERIHLMMNLHYADAHVGMDFEKLLNAPDGDFLHDMFGIDRHMNKSTCKLGGCFLPRCSA